MSELEQKIIDIIGHDGYCAVNESGKPCDCSRNVESKEILSLFQETIETCKVIDKQHSIECNSLKPFNTICDCGTVAFSNGAQAQRAEIRAQLLQAVGGKE